MIFYHVLNRGVDKRKIFMDKKDYYRFIHDLFEFNDEHNVSPNNNRFFGRKKLMDIRCPSVEKGAKEAIRKQRKLLVRIHTFCLMPNHYHMLVSPIKENGIPLFMKKLNMGYAKYFNERYERDGALFQGKYKKVPIETDHHFSHIPYYIHFNPLDLMTDNGEWRERKATDPEAALEFLNNYRWSSHLDYLGKKNFPSVTQRDMLTKVWGGEDGYKRTLPSILRAFSVETVKGSTLE